MNTGAKSYIFNSKFLVPTETGRFLYFKGGTAFMMRR